MPCLVMLRYVMSCRLALKEQTSASTMLANITPRIQQQNITYDKQLLVHPDVNDRSIAYTTALSFLDSLLSPSNCTGKTYAVVDMGTGGGFAAHFQLAASDWMRALAAFKFEVPVPYIRPSIHS